MAAYILGPGRPGSVPPQTCFHMPLGGSQIQTSLSAAPVTMSEPPKTTTRPFAPSKPVACPYRGLGMNPGTVRSVHAGASGSHSHVSCLGAPLAPAMSISRPPNTTARLRDESHTMPKSCRGEGAGAAVRTVHVLVAGSHSHVSPRAIEIPVPSEEDASLRPPPKSSTFLVDFSYTIACWLRAAGCAPALVRLVHAPVAGSHSHVSSKL